MTLSLFSLTSFSQNTCSEIFFKSPLVADIRPDKVLPSLGLYEGRDSLGKPDRSLHFKRQWFRPSPQVKILKEFKKAWDIELYYLIEPVSTTNGKYPTRIETLLNESQVMGILIPLNTLANLENLTQNLMALNANMVRLSELALDQVSFNLTFLSSEGFQLRISEIPQSTTSPAFRWMRTRMLRHGMDFIFTNPSHDPNFHRQIGGQSWGLNVEIRDSFLFSPPEVSLNLLGHEIVHSTSYARMMNQGDVSRMISFWAGTNNRQGLFSTHDNLAGYQKYFRSDEYEAWSITEKFTTDTYTESSIRFLDTQLSWLQQLREELTYHIHYLMYFELNKSQFELPDTLTPHFLKKNYPFILNPKTPDEVIVIIPRLEKREEEVGLEFFLKETIDRRIKYLKKRKEIDLKKLDRLAQKLQNESEY